MRLMSLILTIMGTLLLSGLSLPAAAENANYTFESEAQERQFRQLINELRCPKCQNQSIADSDAPLALDLRERVYQMTKDGASRDEILDFMRSRYGDFVHYKPPMNATTMVLWWGPGLVLLLGVATIIYRVRQQRQEPDRLSAVEQQRLDELMAEEKQQSDKERRE